AIGVVGGGAQGVLCRGVPQPARVRRAAAKRLIILTDSDDAMNLKTTYILFGVLLAVLLLFAATQFSGCDKSGTEKEAFLFADFHAKKSPVKTADVDSVRIERPPAKQALVFTREKSDWRMTEPYALRT